MSAIMLILLGIFAWLFPFIPPSKWILGLICLILVGFLTYGPLVLIAGTMAMDFGTRKNAASAAGFIDGFGYIGAALTGVLSGWLIDNYSWNAAFNFWIAGAFTSALMMFLLWNHKSKKGKFH